MIQEEINLKRKILCPVWEFLFPQASAMFAQCTWKCATSVLLIALLSCGLSPPAQAGKVSEQLQPLSVVQQAPKWQRSKCSPTGKLQTAAGPCVSVT